jgi:5'-nucleotidase
MEEFGWNKNGRRDFLKKSTAAAAIMTLGQVPFSAFGKDADVQLTILHTNDVHSRIEPFPMDGSRNQGMGGVARRAVIIEKIREEQKNVLLLDAGDVFQGTPYFNLYGVKWATTRQPWEIMILITGFQALSNNFPMRIFRLL